MGSRGFSDAALVHPKRLGKRGSGPGARHRPAPRIPEPWESELLRLLAEQGAIPVDQLGRFLGCETGRATALAKHLAKVGYADYGRFLYDEPYWVWLTGRGTRLSGLGFDCLRPKVGAMARMRAVNEVRMHIAARAPEARWICSRTVVREQGRHGPRPNAVVETGHERHAILVKHGHPHGERDERVAIETHMARYDALIVFANPRPRTQLKRLQFEHHWPKLVIRPIPGPPQTASQSQKEPTI